MLLSLISTSSEKLQTKYRYATPLPLLQDLTRLESLTMHGEVTEATALLPSLITEGRDARKPLVVEFFTQCRSRLYRLCSDVSNMYY